MQRERRVSLVSMGALLLAAVLPATLQAGQQGPRRFPIKMTVREVRHQRGSPVVLLQTDGGKRVLPIWIGTSEARVIQLRLTNQQAVRPLTLDLLQTLLGVLGAKVERVEVDDLKDNVFLGKISLRDARGRRYRVDGRPSDLIGIAIGAGLPVWVASHVLDQAGQDIGRWTSPSVLVPSPVSYP